MITKRGSDPISAKGFNDLRRLAARPVSGGGVTSSPAGDAIARPTPPQVMEEAALSCLAFNTDTNNLAKYMPCGIVGSLNSGTDAQTRRQLSVRMPTSSDVGAFAVCAQDMPVGYGNNVYTSGTCLVYIQTNPGDVYADVSPGNGYLVGSPTDGGAQILWEDGGQSTTTHLALIRFPRGSGGGSPEVVWAEAKSSSALTHSGTQTVDTVVLGVGDTVFDAPNVYTVAAGAWTVAHAAPKVVIVAGGSANGPNVWMYNGTGYAALITNNVNSFVVKAKSSTTLTHSGTQTVDGVSCGVGDYVLDGLTIWQVQSGAWINTFTKVPFVGVAQGNANGPLLWIYNGYAYIGIGTWS